MFFTDGPPSSDSESDFSLSGSRPKKAEASNLSAIFSSAKPSIASVNKERKQEPQSSTSSVKTVFSTSVNSFLMREDSEEFEPHLVLGLAVILQQNMIRLILYTPEKKPIHQLILHKGITDPSLLISFTYPYVYFPSGQNFKQLSIIFSNTQTAEYVDFLAWIFLFTNETTKPVRIEEGSGDFTIEIGDSVLVEATQYNLEEAFLKKNMIEARFRVRENSSKFENFKHLIGLKKGGSIVVKSENGEVALLKVRKHKKATEETRKLQEANDMKDFSETVESGENEGNSGDNSEISNLPTVEIEDQEAKSAKPSVLERMAKLGQPVLGMTTLVVEESKTRSRNQSNDKEIEEKEVDFKSNKEEKDKLKPKGAADRLEETIERPPIDEASTSKAAQTKEEKERSLLSDYEIVHRVIGVEMDRLEGRIEERLTRIVNRFEEKIDSIDKKLQLLIDQKTTKTKENPLID